MEYNNSQVKNINKNKIMETNSNFNGSENINIIEDFKYFDINHNYLVFYYFLYNIIL